MHTLLHLQALIPLPPIFKHILGHGFPLTCWSGVRSWISLPQVPTWAWEECWGHTCGAVSSTSKACTVRSICSAAAVQQQYSNDTAAARQQCSSILQQQHSTAAAVEQQTERVALSNKRGIRMQPGFLLKPLLPARQRELSNLSHHPSLPPPPSCLPPPPTSLPPHPLLP